MLINNERARYMLAVVEKWESGGMPADALTDRCPECNKVADSFDREHIVLDRGNGVPVAVVIGCEDYWVIDPNLVGMPSDTWTDWRDPENYGIETPHDI